MNRLAWLDTATAKIRFRPDREAVRRELAAHLEDLREEAGLTEEAAVEAMGDPDETAEELGRLHRPWWGYLWRVSRVVLVLAAAAAIVVVLLWCHEVNHAVFGYRPELPKGDVYVSSRLREWTVLEKWEPVGTKTLGGYRFSVPAVCSVRQETTPTYLIIFLRADTWRFWEPLTSNQFLLLPYDASDNLGNLYHFDLFAGEPDFQDSFCQTWAGVFTTWYLIWLKLPGDAPEWVDIPLGYGGNVLRVNLGSEVDP